MNDLEGGGSAGRGAQVEPRPQQVHDLAGLRDTSPTACLRAAAWQDVGLRNAVLRERVHHGYRAPSREPGIDPDAVVEACQEAKDTSVKHFGALVLVLLPFLLLNLWVFVFGCVIFFLMGAFGAGVSRAGLGKLAVVGTLIAIAVERVASVARDPLAAFNDPYAQSEGIQSTDPAVSAGFLIPFPLAVLLFWGAVLAIAAWARHDSQMRMREAFQTTNDPGSGVGTLPVSFYSDRSPFLGAGVRMDSWPVTLELRNAEKEVNGEAQREAPPEQGVDLIEAVYQRIKDRVHELGAHRGGAVTTSQQVDVADCVFLPGYRTAPPYRVVGELTRSSPGRLRPDWVRAVIATSHERVRHFLEIGVSLWDSQLVVTAFVRLTVRGDSLRLEGETFVMPPIRQRILNGLAAAFTERPGLLEVVRQRLSGLSAIGITHDARPSTKGGTRDYAPRFAIREAASGTEIENLFQHHDLRRMTTAIKERVLRCLQEVLQEQGYRTEAVEQIVQQINYGVQFGDNATVNDTGIHAGANNTSSPHGPRPTPGRN